MFAEGTLCCVFTEMEALEQQKKEKEAAAAAAAAAAPTPTTTQSYTPDYAAGLVAPATPVCDFLLFLFHFLSLPLSVIFISRKMHVRVHARMREKVCVLFSCFLL